MPAARKTAGKPAKGETAPRKRDAAATRTAILKSARKAFAAHGYDGVGVREIAAEAGVTAMLVNRYFGSKEGLFIEVIDDTMSGETIIRDQMPDRSELGAYLAAGMIQTTRPDVTPVDGSLIMFRSASSSNPRLAEIGRKQIEKMQLRRLATAIGGENAHERAAVILSLISGVQLMRQMIGLTPLAKGSPATLQRILASLIQDIADGKR